MPAAATSWGPVAEWYDGLLEGDKDSYQQQVILPNLLRLLAPKAGERILDVACGSGFFARAAAAAGAQVTASDVSAELVKLAKEKLSSNIRYHVAPAHRQSFLEAGSADKAMIVLALQNIKEIRETLKEIARVLKPFG